MTQIKTMYPQNHQIMSKLLLQSIKTILPQMIYMTNPHHMMVQQSTICIKTAVIDQSIETTKDIKKQANTLESNIKSNASKQSDDYESTLTSELAKYGYSSFEQLNDYCITSVKEKEMNKKYITKHFDEVKKAWEEKSPRTVSIIKMEVSDADNLTETETKKKNNIDKALEKESFADVAKAFSEDSNTANKKGFAGYVDSDSTNVKNKLRLKFNFNCTC